MSGSRVSSNPGRQEGAEVVTGGQVIGNQGYFVEPTVLARTDRSMRVVREEIFGPVVCVQSFDDERSRRGGEIRQRHRIWPFRRASGRET